MTASLLPWHIYLETIDVSAAGNDPHYVAYIRDARGNNIGYFRDPRDAELVLLALKGWEEERLIANKVSLPIANVMLRRSYE